MPELFKQKGGGDDGGACIKGEAILLMDIGAATGRIALLEHADFIAARSQPYGCSQTAKAAADDKRRRLPLGREIGHRGLRLCQHRMTLPLSF